MPSKQIIYGAEARQKALAGVIKLADAVVTTLGPRGRNVALDRPWGIPKVVHDGVTVAQDITLEDKFENMGAQLVLQAAERTNDNVGDGTTTSILLARELTEQGMKLVDEGVDPMKMRDDIMDSTAKIIERLGEMKKDVTKADWKRVATISAQNAAIGEKIAEAIELVGENGIVEVEQGTKTETVIIHKDGMEFERGYLSPYFITDKVAMAAEYRGAYILVTDQKINAIADLLPIIQPVVDEKMPMVIIADDFSDEVVLNIIANKTKGVFNCMLVKAPAYGERRRAILEDIAIMTNATLITMDLNLQLSKVTLAELGRASVKSTKNSTRITDGEGIANIPERIVEIDEQIKQADSEFDKEKLRERKARLTGGIAVIQVGAPTEAEATEMLERVRDAKEATMAAIKSGIIAGGGISLKLAARGCGNTLLETVCSIPFSRLAKSFGLSEAEFEESLEGSEVIEPTLVATESLRNAVGVATTILTCECLVADAPEKK